MPTRFESWDDQVKAARAAQAQAEPAEPPPVKAPVIAPPAAAPATVIHPAPEPVRGDGSIPHGWLPRLFLAAMFVGCFLLTVTPWGIVAPVCFVVVACTGVLFEAIEWASKSIPAAIVSGLRKAATAKAKADGE